ncbi:phycocyanin alpha-subunit phycocyanobilin lyase [Cyanobium sp. PCC 7001]|uniref:HEAT repeat domain-containing protein n=1 Tax=Cyanobium sp. PCC 7001 TaxID=180281 RepID=UPI0001805440|nr:HEAT repeat domain-containing protein [Cyanobium sp. PCC 7001]EDY38719.1 phycocyanin alpha-subunit phycocyanobilin lyase [Cyanobium sp. PCC 7001]
MSGLSSVPLSGSDGTVAALIAAVEQAGSSDALVVATRALAGCGDQRAAPTLVEVLGFNNPGAAVAAVEGLITLGGAAVEALLRLDAENYGARAWAVRALAGIGDVRGLELLVDALGTDVAASVRRAAARGLGQLDLGALEPLERRSVREQCLEALLAATADGEWVVRYAVAVGLESLAAELPEPDAQRQRSVAGLLRLAEASDENPRVVQLRAELALQRLETP